MFYIVAIKISPRNKTAPKVQEILTKHGCIIKTRLGLHEASIKNCSTSGLILLDLIGDDKEKINDLTNELNSLEAVKAKLLEI
ncbi:hypothetical protein [Clostridium oceanicum]|uniref:Iron-only hydrogenase system regulator n=1 Tax=Clostridium oceanicum TaxID=1543 RepID=A0ABN1JNG2_9CLOT